MTIWASHGVVRDRNHQRFVHRNLLDLERVERFLAKSSDKFVPLELAIKNEGSALTIDDNTVAAADLARIALTYGHSVTLFVSARNAIDRVPYVFHTLNVVLDKMENAAVNVGERLIEIDPVDVKAMIRRWVKDQFAPLGTYEKQAAVIEQFAHLATVDDLAIPSYLKVLSENDLLELRNLGVDIQNHGWEHVDLSEWNSEDIVELIEKGRQYLEAALGVTARHFAVPFGEVSPTVQTWTGPGTWFLASGHAPSGWVKDKVYNRPTFKAR
jgi:hypothetical protein